MITKDDRRSVAAFFAMKPDGSRLEAQPPRFGVAFLVGCVALAIVAAALHNGRHAGGESLGIGLAVAMVAFMIVLAIDMFVRAIELEQRRTVQAAHNKHYLELADVTRSVMQHDADAALLRAFHRAQLDADQLHALDEIDAPATQRPVIAIETREEMVADLKTKCVHGRRPALRSDGHDTQVVWLSQGGYREWLSNRIELGTLFVPEQSALVLCEQVVDLVTGSIRDRILRVPYEKMVSLCLRSECDVEYAGSGHAQEQRNTRLVLTMADGGAVEIPLSFTQVYTSDFLTPLDRPEMTPDEHLADRILTWLETKSTASSQSSDVVELHSGPSYAPPRALGERTLP